MNANFKTKDSINSRRWRVMLACGLCLFLTFGCKRNNAPTDSSVTNQAPNIHPGPDEPEVSAAYQRQKEDLLAYAAKIREERLRSPLTNEVPLPNFPSGVGLPRPLGVNFYQIDHRYPAYLLCLYDVYENRYDQTNEPEWFKAALLQIRATGQQRFPSIRWVAVAVVNRAEHRGESTFEQSFKAGAIFTANDVFDFSNDLQEPIRQAKADRRPFKYDSKSEEQQHWMIVERHANLTNSNSPTNAPR